MQWFRDRDVVQLAPSEAVGEGDCGNALQAASLYIGSWKSSLRLLCRVRRGLTYA